MGSISFHNKSLHIINFDMHNGGQKNITLIDIIDTYSYRQSTIMYNK